MTGTAHFRDLSRLTALLKGALVVFIASAAVGLWSGWLEIELLRRVVNGTAIAEEEANASDSRQALQGRVYFLSLLATGIIFLRWIYLAHLNARSLAAAGMQYTPGWAVGWYFIPVANLWKPYQAMRETFRASHPDFTDNWREAPRPRILPVWWTLWIISTYVASAVLRSALRADTADAFLASSRISFASDLIDLPLGVAAIAVVARLHLWQRAKHDRVASAAT